MTRILITGGDHTGKDSLAQALCGQNSDLVYTAASSRQIATLVEEWQDGRDLHEWWLQRRHHRQEWIAAFDTLRHTRRPGIFATYLFEQGESIVTGLRFTSELIDLLNSAVAPHIILWCRYANRPHIGNDILTLDLTAQLAALQDIPVLVVWSDVHIQTLTGLIQHLSPPRKRIRPYPTTDVAKEPTHA